MNFFRGVMGGQSAGAQPSGGETIQKLCDRVASSTLLEDRRDAVRALKSLSKVHATDRPTRRSWVTPWTRCTTSSAAKRKRNKMNRKLVRVMVSPVNSPGATASCQKSMFQCGLLQQLCTILMATGVPADILTETINTVSEVIRGSQVNQDYFASVNAPSNPPRPAIVVLLMSMVNERQPFVLRCAVLYCFQCFLYKNHKGQAEIVSTLLPSTIDAQSISAGQLLCGGLFSADSLSNWCASVALAHALHDNSNQKEQLLRVQLATSLGKPPISLLQQCTNILSQGSKVQTRVGLLMLLCTWISNCPIAVTHFLHNQENVPFLTAQISENLGEDERLVQGLCALLLGICIYYNDNSLENYTKEKLKQLIEKRIGKENFVEKLGFITKHELYSRAAQKPQPAFSTPEHMLFDHEFTKLVKELEGVITKAVHKSSEEEKKEEEVKKTLEQHDSIVTQYKELIREQKQSQDPGVGDAAGQNASTCSGGTDQSLSRTLSQEANPTAEVFSRALLGVANPQRARPEAGAGRRSGRGFGGKPKQGVYSRKILILSHLSSRCTSLTKMTWRPQYRSSKFRHVFGKAATKENCYDGVPITHSVHDNHLCAVNPRFLAVITECAGGGAFLVLSISHTGKVDPHHPRISGHRGNVLDIKWNPFNDFCIASCSEDTTVKVWDIPKHGVMKNITVPSKELQGHSRRVGLIEWHPTASDIMFSTGYDYQETNTKTHRASKVMFLGNVKMLLSTGNSRWNNRQIALWDQGDGNIRYYEISSEKPYVHYLTEYRSLLPQKGMGVMPKRGLDVCSCEVFRFYRLVTTKSLIEPLSMIVPRRSEAYQEDIYPMTAGKEPAMTAEEWLSGKDKEIKMPEKVIYSEPQNHGSQSDALEPP
ncbi:hypothetical protein PDJAM_G00180820 [Pangasius djambal]|uniref:Uncharacterized protein n=1 Tax=Pangasius djambal TaxID=1691987 RepID=A0ACC5Y409_9TELE|nr:hypothetical protein [Pangasius djambal]